MIVPVALKSHQAAKDVNCEDGHLNDDHVQFAEQSQRSHEVMRYSSWCLERFDVEEFAVHQAEEVKREERVEELLQSEGLSILVTPVVELIVVNRVAKDDRECYAEQSIGNQNQYRERDEQSLRLSDSSE